MRFPSVSASHKPRLDSPRRAINDDVGLRQSPRPQCPHRRAAPNFSAALNRARQKNFLHLRMIKGKGARALGSRRPKVPGLRGLSRIIKMFAGRFIRTGLKQAIVNAQILRLNAAPGSSTSLLMRSRNFTSFSMMSTRKPDRAMARPSDAPASPPPTIRRSNVSRELSTYPLNQLARS